MDSLRGTILVADDEASVRWVLAKALDADGHVIVEAENGAVALDRLTAGGLDLAFVDLRMPEVSGLDVLARCRAAGVQTPVIIITAQTTMANAIEATKRGAYDYITKPFDVDEIRAVTRRALETVRMTTELQRLEQEFKEHFEFGVTVIGKSPPMQEIYKTIGRVARTDATVLIEGESGTGKELIAKVLHYHSHRWSGPFVALNCSAIPRDLLESELFGHERGAFTGAVEQRAGKFELAHGGTLFLDEIGDMPPDLQAKLLRVLQDRIVIRVGGREELKVDCRIVAATNRNLERAVAEHRFRQDLFFRLNVVPITMPPLRERRGDIPDLVNFFIDKTNREMGTSVRAISPDARDMLVRHDWPGNVRELENTLIRAAVLLNSPTLTARDLALGTQEVSRVAYDELSLEEVVRLKLKEYFRKVGEVGPSNLYAAIIGRIERPLIELALDHAGGNQLQAAALLGINRNTLRKKMNALKIKVRAETRRRD